MTVREKMELFVSLNAEADVSVNFKYEILRSTKNSKMSVPSIAFV